LVQFNKTAHVTVARLAVNEESTIVLGNVRLNFEKSLAFFAVAAGISADLTYLTHLKGKYKTRAIIGARSIARREMVSMLVTEVVSEVWQFPAGNRGEPAGFSHFFGNLQSL